MSSNSDLLQILSDNKPIHYQVRFQTLFRTDSLAIKCPFQVKEAKNYILSSGLAPYRPYKGILPPPGGGGASYAIESCSYLSTHTSTSFEIS